MVVMHVTLLSQGWHMRRLGAGSAVTGSCECNSKAWHPQNDKVYMWLSVYATCTWRMCCSSAMWLAVGQEEERWDACVAAVVPRAALCHHALG